MSAHIIAVTSPEQARELTRRQADRDLKTQARTLDEIVTQSRLYFDLFMAEYQQALRENQMRAASRYAGLAHEHAHILKIAGIEKVCPCALCEVMARAKAEEEVCGKTGGGYAGTQLNGE